MLHLSDRDSWVWLKHSPQYGAKSSHTSPGNTSKHSTTIAGRCMKNIGNMGFKATDSVVEFVKLLK